MRQKAGRGEIDMAGLRDIWLAAGLRTPFAKIDAQLAGSDVFGLSVPVVQSMLAKLQSGRPDFVGWGSVVPNLGWSNLAREVCLEAKIDPTIPAFTTILACGTSMVGVFEAAGMLDGHGRDLAIVGGVESMSHTQIGLGRRLSDWLRHVVEARSLRQRAHALAALRPRDIRLHIPTVTNRAAGARILSQAVKELAALPSGGRAIVSFCASVRVDQAKSDSFPKCSARR
jgi:acetyl-CoA C-acetyltransferase